MGCHDGADLVIADEPPRDERLRNGEKVEQQIVITQTTRIVVEPAQQHHRHEVEHHEFHACHLRLRRRRLLVTVIGESEGRKRHQ